MKRKSIDYRCHKNHKEIAIIKRKQYKVLWKNAFLPLRKQNIRVKSFILLLLQFSLRLFFETKTCNAWWFLCLYPNLFFKYDILFFFLPELKTKLLVCCDFQLELLGDVFFILMCMNVLGFFFNFRLSPTPSYVRLLWYQWRKKNWASTTFISNRNF